MNRADPGPNDGAQVPPHPALVDGPIYLDYNATTPVDPRVVEALLPYLSTHFGNPSSAHHAAEEPRAALARARARVAALIGAAPSEVVFTGSGTESNALAIRGASLAALTADPGSPRVGRPHVITQVSEHPAVLGACEALHRLHGIDITRLPVDSAGRVHPDSLRAAMTEQTVLVSVMHANNETGVIQPITDLAAITHAHGALFHTDAAQTVGKIPVDVVALDVDLLTLVGHKMYAPKGIAALYLRTGVRLEPLVHGGGQEHGLRAGTENVALAVALGAAADLAGADLVTGTPDRLRDLRDHLHQTLAQSLPGTVHLNGHPHRRLPHTLNVSIDGVTSHALLAALPQLAASTGSACHSGTTRPSPVLHAMGVPDHRALASIRLSLGRWTSEPEIQRVATLLASAAVDLRSHPGSLEARITA